MGSNMTSETTVTATIAIQAMRRVGVKTFSIGEGLGPNTKAPNKPQIESHGRTARTWGLIGAVGG